MFFYLSLINRTKKIKIKNIQIVGHALHGRAATQRLYIIWSLRDLGQCFWFCVRFHDPSMTCTSIYIYQHMHARMLNRKWSPIIYSLVFCLFVCLVSARADICDCFFFSLFQTSSELTQVFAERLNESLQLAQRSGLQIIFRIHLTQSHSFSHHQDHQNLVKFSQMIYNRIEFSNLMKEVLQHTHLGLQVRRAEVGSGIGVTACGPTSMISSLRNAIADTDPSITDQVGGISVHW